MKVKEGTKTEGKMIAVFDNHYFDETVRSAVCCIQDWSDDIPALEKCMMDAISSDYVPGEFFRRELPSIIKLIQELDVELHTLVIDGYVDLSTGRPGLGRHLYNHFEEQVPVIGVAKNAFKESDTHHEVLRGESQSPVFITACGLDTSTAADYISAMHGQFRIPSILKCVDRLARDGE